MGGVQVRVGIISPREVVRAGLAGLLAADQQVLIAPHEASDVVVFDVGGLTDPRTRLLLRRHVEARRRVLGLLTRAERHLGRGALVLGASTVVPETVSAPELAEAVRTLASRGRAPAQWPALVGTPLTTRELEVLRLVAAGLSNDQVAQQLHLSLNSVKTYIRVSYRKIGVDRRAQAVRWVIAHGQAEQVPSVPADDMSAPSVDTGGHVP